MYLFLILTNVLQEAPEISSGSGRGVFRGGYGAIAPPLGRQDSIISIE